MGEVTRALLVGEVNPHSSDPRMALHVEPAGAAGSRLAKILGMSPERYLQVFDRVNLCDGAWEAGAARARATRLAAERGLDVASDTTLRVMTEADLAGRRGGSPVVLLGARVCRAFGVPFVPFAAFELAAGRDAEPALRGVVLPHPSGLCRVWNDLSSAARASSVVATLLASLAEEGEA